jgi:hypothetical protein
LPPKGSTPTIEPLVFTVAATPPKAGTVGGAAASTAAAVSDTYKSLFHWALSKHLRAAGSDVEVVAADPDKFHSMIRQPHRPSEKAVHVKAFRGSKDGYLFFLTNGILWGFKKPLLFIPLDRVAAVSYTSVLQRTFNMVAEVFTGEGDATEEIEFAMIDQEDFAGIDESYVKRNRLQDRSMAERRKAKIELAENLKVPKKGDTSMTDAPVNGHAAKGGAAVHQSALLEAVQQMGDEDDEDEEDYDPGSEGDSEGSGESSDDDDDDDDDDDNDDDDEGEDNEDGEEGEGDEEEE